MQPVMPEFTTDNFGNLHDYFTKIYAPFAQLKVRGAREELSKLADNSAGWKFEGDTSSIVDFAKSILLLDPIPKDRASFAAVIGGSGSGLKGHE